jgi:6-phosphogluconolactonase
MKSVEVRKATNPIDVAQQASFEIIETIKNVLVKKNSVHIALTGGTVGILTLEVLGKAITEQNLDISKVHFWWGDERFVESNSADRNFNQAKNAMPNVLGTESAKIHAFPASDEGLDLESARRHFTQHIKDVLGESQPAMDLTILGMGPDGHVASLFPGMNHDGDLVVAVDNSPKPPPERLSFSLDLINRSDKIIFVVAGIDKAEAVESVHKNPECDLPAAKVEAKSQTLWIIDEAAGAAFWSC